MEIREKEYPGIFSIGIRNEEEKGEFRPDQDKALKCF
jgi:hypothetical protein